MKKSNSKNNRTDAAQAKLDAAKAWKNHGLNYTPFQFPTEIKASEPRKPGSGFEKMETATLAANCLTTAYELANRAAKGEPDAAGYLVSAARELTLELTALCAELPELCSSIAVKSPLWPVLDSLHPDTRKANAALFLKLKLGRDAEISGRKSSKWSRDSVATRYAMAMIEVIRANRNCFAVLKKSSLPRWVHDANKLPPLSKSTAAKWCEVGWQALLEIHPEPGAVKELQKLGRPECKQIDGDIKGRILKAMQSIARCES